MKATLIYPPCGDPRGPQLALPSLAAALRGSGVQVDLLDLNVLGFEALLQPDLLEQAVRRLRDSLGTRLDWSEPRSRMALLGESLLQNVPDSFTTLRSPEHFYDANDHSSARAILESGLALTCMADPRGVACAFFPARYGVPGVDPQKLSHLIDVTADPAANLFAEHWEQDVFPGLEAVPPDLVGISITNRQQILPGLMLARGLRQRGHFVVIGGTVYSKFADALARRPAFFEAFADAVVVYEGETALLALLDQLAGSREFENVPNLLFQRGDSVQATIAHVEDVRSLPTPDFSGLPLASYLVPEPVLPILAGKGCYYNRCRFCDIAAINRVSRKAYRVREAEQIAADVRALAARFGCRNFVITDEALSPKLLVKLADALGTDGDHSFTGYARLEPGFTPEVFERLHEMGMRKLFFGLESGCQQTLDHMDKGTRIADAPTILKHCRQAGIDFHLFSIIGFPEEDEAAARKTFAFLVDNQEIIDHPGNSFDMHAFGLEFRTSYCDERAKLGVEIAAEALEKDFVIGIAPQDWTNTRGLANEDVRRLIEEEFYPALRAIFERHHNTAAHLWPGFEEYSVLYGRHYHGRPFPFTTSLPDTGDPSRVRLRWNPLLDLRLEGEEVGLEGQEVRITGPSASFSMNPTLFDLLGDGLPRNVDEFLSAWLGEMPEPAREESERMFRQLAQRCIGMGFLQVELADVKDEGRTFQNVRGMGSGK